MPKNMGSVDKIIRVVLALGIGALIVLKVLTGTAAVIGAVVGFAFVLTSLISFCPLYVPFKISTEGKK